MDDRKHHDELRCREARQGYINWRMNDLPSVYQSLLPYSYEAKTLWAAEKAIRRQYAIDQEAARSPWRRIGPQCGLIDTSGMSGAELIAFACEASIPVGMEDQPKRGGVFDRATDAGKRLAAEATQRSGETLDPKDSKGT